MVEIAIAAVALRTALKYRKNWNKTGPTVKLLQSLMPSDGSKKGFRLYYDIGDEHKKRFHVPDAVRVALRREGYRVTDYLAKKCVKISDKEQKNEYNIGKVIGKDEHAKRAFDNDPQLQNSKSNKIQVVISCHPYDIIGMSTGRDWDKTSCMRLNDGISNRGDAGAYHSHVEADVAEGTLVAYAVRSNDLNISKPLARCLIKPFHSADSEDILYRRESRVYGNPVPGFGTVLSKFLRTINAKIPKGYYEMLDSLYDDGGGRSIDYSGDTSDIDAESVSDDPDLLIPFAEQQAKRVKNFIKNGADPEGPFRVFVEQFSRLPDIPEEDIDEIAALFPRGVEQLREGVSDRMMMYDISPNVARLARKMGLLDSFSKPEDEAAQNALKKLPAVLGLKMAHAGGIPYESLVNSLEALMADPEEYSDNDKAKDHVGNFLKKSLNGAYPIPEASVFDNAPNLKSLLFTAASAGRFMSLTAQSVWTDDVRACHDLFDILQGTPKAISEDAIWQMWNGFPAAMYVCYLLDNDSESLDQDIVFRMDPDDISDSCLMERRLFRALDRCKNRMTQYFMDHVKFHQFKKCIKNPSSLQMYKDNKQILSAHMVENREMFTEIDWLPDTVSSLAAFNPQLLQYVLPNCRGTFDKDIWRTVSQLFPKIQEWNGDPIEMDDNLLLETTGRLAVYMGRLLKKPIDISSKFTFEDISLDDFPAWYTENKESGMPTLTAIMKYARVGLGAGATMQQPYLTKIMSQVIADAPKSPDIFAGFRPIEIIEHSATILDAIRTKMPNIFVASSALSYFVESIELDEPLDIEAHVRNQVMPQVGFDEYDERFEQLMAEGIERELSANGDPRIAVIEHNKKLVAIATSIVNDIGRNDGDVDEHIREFFKAYPVDQIDDAEDALENMGEEIYSHVMNLEDELRGMVEGSDNDYD